jgi:hypothetical protein
MILLITGIFIGSIVGYLLCRRDWKSLVAQLEDEKQQLCEFNEKIRNDRDEIENRYAMTFRGYVNHLDTHVCQRIPVGDEVLEAEFVE